MSRASMPKATLTANRISCCAATLRINCANNKESTKIIINEYQSIKKLFIAKNLHKSVNL